MIFSDAAKFFAKFVLLCLFVSAAPLHALDLTGEGMSDVWQRVHNIANGDGNSDPDGDGQSNLREAEAGTNPRDTNDYFKSFDFAVSPARDLASISWRSMEERLYEVEKSTDLTTWIIAGSSYGQSGLSSRASFKLGQPVNDLFMNRWPVSTSSTQTLGSNVEATSETGEPINPDVAGKKTAWWSWSSNTSGSVTITTPGSDFDTTLAIYSGADFSNLVLLGANDDSGGMHSSVTFIAQAGVPYSLQVDGYAGRTGAIVLNHPISSGVLPPPAVIPSGPSKMFLRVRGLPSNDPDYDLDSLLNWEERLLGSNPSLGDSDNDGMEDIFEFTYEFNLVSAADANQDADGDGISNLFESRLKLNPRSRDSNQNGISDALEDPDFDGLGNLAEITT